MSKNLLAAVETVNNLEQKKAELRVRYKQEVQRMEASASAVTKKLDAARTHAVMSSAPNLVKALGLSNFLNITISDIQESKSLQEKLSNSNTFNVVFEDFVLAMNAVADYIYNRDDISAEIRNFVESEIRAKYEHGKL